MQKFITIKTLDHNSVFEILSKFEFIFSSVGKSMTGITIDFSKIIKKNSNSFGLLLMYKILEFNTINKCFSGNLLEDKDKNTFAQLLVDTSFWPLYKNIIDKNSNYEIVEDLYKRSKLIFEDRFFIAPHPLLRETNFTKEYFENKYLPEIKKFYENELKQKMLFDVFSEITSNFWQHAVADSKSILVSNGTEDKVEISCIDTAIGIISSLKSKFPNLSHEKIILKSVEFEVTSKENTNHMGHGLWIINELVNLSDSRLHIYSEGTFYKNDYGKVSSGKCGYWKGSIIYVNLNLKNPKTVGDLKLKYPKYERANGLLINFI